MENPLNITAINDFIFCPVSIYFHNLYGDMEKTLYQSTYQINGTKAHESVDQKKYSGPASLQGLSVYCEKYNLIGKIDLYEIKSCKLIERKKKINIIYDGYVFQLYAQYFAMTEMGYKVDSLVLRSIDDNKNYYIKKPEYDINMFLKFEETINAINEFNVEDFVQTNGEKCKKCIYAPYCSKEVI